MSFAKLLVSFSGRSKSIVTKTRKQPRLLHAFELLEDRLVPTVYYWKGGDSGGATDWSIAGNWSSSADGSLPGDVPTAADEAYFNSTAPINQVSLLGANQAVQKITFANVDPISILNTGGFALTVGAGGIEVLNSTAAPISIAATVSTSAAASFLNNSASTFTLGGTINYPDQLTLGGSGTFVISGATAGTGTAGLKVDGAWLQVGDVASLGPAGNTLTLNSGKFSSDSGTARAIATPLVISGNVTLGDTTNNGALSFSNASQSVTASNAVVTLLGSNAVSFITNALSLAGGSNTTFTSAATPLNLTGGFATNGQTVTLTLNTGTNAVTVSGALTSGGGKLVLAGSGTGATGTGIALPVFTGATNDAVEINSTTGGAFILSGNHDYTGGFTLRAGRAIIGAGIVFGPGSLEIAGGTIRTDSTTARTITNELTISGSFTFSTAASLADIILSPTSGTINLTGASTISALNNVLTLQGRIAGSTNPLGVRGFGQVALINASGTPSVMGAVTVGDVVAAGSLGGRLNVSSQNAMGVGPYTLNYGGLLNPTTNFSPANQITINTGGNYGPTLAAGGITVFNNALNSAIQSGGLLTNASSQTLTIAIGTGANQVSLPTAGLLNLSATNAIALTGAYPSLTGTLVLGGGANGSASIATSAPTTLSSAPGSDRTIAFTNYNNGTFSSINGTGGIGQGSAFAFNGLILNANLTLAGGSNYGTLSNSPQIANVAISSLGTITETGSRSITVNLAPAGIVALTATPTGWTGGTTINNGTLQINSAGTVDRQLGTGGLTLNGGVLRVFGSAATTVQDPIVVGPRGGALETYSNGAGGNVTFSGDITKLGGNPSGPLTLRYDYITATTGSPVITLSGNNASFDSGFILAANGNRGRIQFNGVAATGSDGSGTFPNTNTVNTITVPSGVTFGFDSLGTLTSTIAKFATSTGSVLNLANLTSSAIDLTVLNKDIRLGSYGNNTFSGTYTPFTDTYKFSSANGTLTLNTANRLTGANNLDVSGVPVAAGAHDNNNVGSGTPGVVAITAAQNFSGTTSVTGVIRNAAMGLHDGFNAGTANSLFSRQTLTLSASLGSTSGITVERTGILTITGGTSGAATPNVPIVVRGLGVLNNSVTNGLTATGALTLGGTSGGGTYATTTSTTQSLTSLTVSGGSNAITGNGGLTLTGPAASVYTRTAGGSLNVALPTNTGFSVPPASSSVIGGILVGAVLTTGTTAADFVAAASGTMAAPTTYTAQSAAGSWGAGQNITNTNNTTVLTGTTPNTALAINSLRNYGSTSTATVNLGAPLTVSSGMILQTAANTLNISGSTLQSGNGQDLIFNVNQGTVQVSSQITGGLALTKAGGGTLTLTNSNTIGDLYLLGGTLNAGVFQGGGAGALGTVAGSRTWYLQGGTLNFNVNPNTGGSAQYANVNVVANPAPNGTFIFVESPSTTFNVIIGGPNTTVTMNSYLGITTGANGNNRPGILTLAGKLSGPGALTNSRTNNASGRSVTVLANDNSAWSGGVFLRNGAQFRFANAKAFGTGPIVNSSNPGNANYLPGIVSLIVTDAATGVMNVANDFSLNGTVALGNWKTDTSGGAVTPLNLSGKIMGAGGLLIQGVVTGGNVSETVLSGTVSLAGVPGIYSYGETNAIQNFVNGPGGISLGATDYQNSLTALAPNSSSRVDMPGTHGTVATRGALGFVRFSADATGAQNSFIPGQVGPGYLAALHQAADTVNQTGNFGYLLTGHSTIAAASWSTGTVTVTTSANHGLTVGQQVAITGMTPSAYNGTYAVVSASGTTFTYALVADPGTATAFGKVNGDGVFALPEGKSILIGSLGLQGAGVGQVGGVLGSAGGGTSILTGSAKLPGFDAGDVNIHANAAGDSQTLSLLARNAADTFQIGDIGSKVVFSPTYGDSGATTTITLMSTRTGATTLNKTGLGTVIVKNVEFNNIAGAANSAKAGFTFNVNAGTLQYDQVDTGASFAALNVNTGGTLSGTGKVNANVVVNANATLAPGVAVGTTLGVNGNLSLGGISEFQVIGGAVTADKVNMIASLTYGGDLKIAGTGFVAGDRWDLFDSTTQSGTFANDAVFGTSGDGGNLPSLPGGLFWHFDYATGVLQVIGAPTITSVVPVIGPTIGGTIVNIYGSSFASVTSVTFGSTVFLPGSFTVTGTTQITVISPSNLGVPGTADIAVTNTVGEGSLAGPDDFTYAQPALASVVVNGGPGVVLGGSTFSLVGQNSVVKQIVVTFNQAVTLASDAFTVTSVPLNPSGGAGFVKVNGGAVPSTESVTASIGATLSPSSYLITFSGAGTHHGGVINSGVYDLNIIASKVSANGETMASDQKSTFFAMFGTVNANDTLSGPPGGFIGDGLSKAFVDPGSLFQFSDAFGSTATNPAGPPPYNIVFDYNLDGAIDPGDLFAFSDTFGIDWSF